MRLPEGLKISGFELRMFLAVKLFDEGLISTGQGAVMVGLSKQAFIEMLGKYKVSVFQYDINEIEEDAASCLVSRFSAPVSRFPFLSSRFPLPAS